MSLELPWLDLPAIIDSYNAEHQTTINRQCDFEITWFNAKWLARLNILKRCIEDGYLIQESK